MESYLWGGSMRGAGWFYVMLADKACSAVTKVMINSAAGTSSVLMKGGDQAGNPAAAHGVLEQWGGFIPSVAVTSSLLLWFLTESSRS